MPMRLFFLLGLAMLVSLGASPVTSQPVARDAMADFLSRVLGSTEVEWAVLFAQIGRNYDKPILVLYSGRTSSACGVIKSERGTRYCAKDRQIYVDPINYNAPAPHTVK